MLFEGQSVGQQRIFMTRSVVNGADRLLNKTIVQGSLASTDNGLLIGILKIFEVMIRILSGILKSILLSVGRSWICGIVVA